MTLSVIVPTLNEADGLPGALQRARRGGVLEIIVVDGGSRDATRTLAASLADLVITAPTGRAAQMNAGALRARGDILLFLHADTLLPDGFAEAVMSTCARPGVVGGRFDVELDPATPLLHLTAALMNWRSRLTGIATGDQAIFVRRDVFARLGGFKQIPLMEDIDMSRRLKRAGHVVCLRQRVITSARRWHKNGVARTIALMWALRLLYFLGVPPARLQRLYDNKR
ncbi:MAG: TIGR04283 family arsenosugar biosynthesis glycosyltransferase [Candidatus Binatia bacterium]